MRIVKVVLLTVALSILPPSSARAMDTANLTANSSSSSQSGSVMSAPISLNYKANSKDAGVWIHIYLASAPSAGYAAFKYDYRYSPPAAGNVIINLSPTIAPTVTGTYTYVVWARVGWDVTGQTPAYA